MKYLIIFLSLISNIVYGIFPDTHLYIQNRSQYKLTYNGFEVYKGILEQGSEAYIGSLEDTIKSGLALQSKRSKNNIKQINVNLVEVGKLAQKNPKVPINITFLNHPKRRNGSIVYEIALRKIPHL